jgi:Tfp pilus assembly protein PilV
MNALPFSIALRRAGRARRSAFSLLEVVLALAILTFALVACLQLVYLGIRHAREARDRTRAQEICESILGLITSGVLDVNGVAGGQQSVPDVFASAGIGYGTADGDLDLQAQESDWLCSITTQSSEVQDVLKVTVTVTEDSASDSPTEFTLVRWLLNPVYVQSLGQTSDTGAP